MHRMKAAERVFRSACKVPAAELGGELRLEKNGNGSQHTKDARYPKVQTAAGYS